SHVGMKLVEAIVKEGDEMLYRIAYWVAQRIAGAVVAALGGLRVEGGGDVPGGGGVGPAADPASTLAPPAVGPAGPDTSLWVAKGAFFRIPVRRGVMRFFHAFPVRPDAADRGALRQAAEILEAGETLLVFPEGSCSRTSELLPFRPGLALIALRAGMPIVPT